MVSGPATVTSGGLVTITGAGSVVVKAEKDGDNNYNAVSYQITIKIDKAKQADLIIDTIGSKNTDSAPFQLSATGGSGDGAITYTLISGPATVTSEGLVTIKGLGTIVVTAVKAGNGNYSSVTSEAYSIYVSLAAISQNPFSINSVGTKIFKDSPFQLTTQGGSGLGAVTFSITSGSAATVSSSGLVTIVRAGTVTIRATKAGDGTYSSTSATISITIGAIPLTLSSVDTSTVSMVYNGAVQTCDTLTLTDGTVLTRGIDYTAQSLGTDLVNAGATVNVAVTFAGNYSGTASFNVIIEQAEIIGSLTLSYDNTRLFGIGSIVVFTAKLNGTTITGPSLVFTVVQGTATILDDAVKFTGGGTIKVRATIGGTGTNYKAKFVEVNLTATYATSVRTFGEFYAAVQNISISTILLDCDITDFAFGTNDVVGIGGDIAPSARALVINGNGFMINFGIQLQTSAFDIPAVVTIKNLIIEIHNLAGIEFNIENLGGLGPNHPGQVAAISITGANAGSELRLENVIINIGDDINNGDHAIYGIYVNILGKLTATNIHVDNAGVTTNAAYGVWTSNLANTTISGSILKGGTALGVGGMVAGTGITNVTVTGRVLFVAGGSNVLLNDAGTNVNDIILNSTYFSTVIVNFITALVADSTGNIAFRIYEANGGATFTYSVSDGFVFDRYTNAVRIFTTGEFTNAVNGVGGTTYKYITLGADLNKDALGVDVLTEIGITRDINIYGNGYVIDFGMIISGSVTVNISNLEIFITNTDYAVQADGTNTAGILIGLNATVKIESVTVRALTAYGIYITDSVVSVTLEQITVENTSSLTGYGIWTSNPANTHISDSTVEGWVALGIGNFTSFGTVSSNEFIGTSPNYTILVLGTGLNVKENETSLSNVELNATYFGSAAIAFINDTSVTLQKYRFIDQGLNKVYSTFTFNGTVLTVFVYGSAVEGTEDLSLTGIGLYNSFTGPAANNTTYVTIEEGACTMFGKDNADNIWNGKGITTVVRANLNMVTDEKVILDFSLNGYDHNIIASMCFYAIGGSAGKVLVAFGDQGHDNNSFAAPYVFTEVNAGWYSLVVIYYRDTDGMLKANFRLLSDVGGVSFERKGLDIFKLGTTVAAEANLFKGVRCVNATLITDKLEISGIRQNWIDPDNNGIFNYVYNHSSKNASLVHLTIDFSLDIQMELSNYVLLIDIATIEAVYLAFQAAYYTNNQAQMAQYANLLGNDVIITMYYMNGVTPVPIATKFKMWDGYINRVTGSAATETVKGTVPETSIGAILLAGETYSTSTNIMDPVKITELTGKTIYIEIIIIYQGRVFSAVTSKVN